MTVAEQVKAERDLGEILQGYAGQWVAVRDYEVIASAESLGGLLGKVEGEQAGGQEPTVFKVADKDVTCFY
jgi:hypothetical protein